MLCYKDMTFCVLQHCKDFSTCHRALTDQVREDANKWMKDPPIAVFANIPKCFKMAQKGQLSDFNQSQSEEEDGVKHLS